jgi:hypothetical protein
MQGQAFGGGIFNVVIDKLRARKFSYSDYVHPDFTLHENMRQVQELVKARTCAVRTGASFLRLRGA